MAFVISPIGMATSTSVQPDSQRVVCLRGELTMSASNDSRSSSFRSFVASCVVSAVMLNPMTTAGAMAETANHASYLITDTAVMAPPATLPNVDFTHGADVFEANCAACHLGGGNVIPMARGKTLKTKALQKNHAFEHDELKAFIQKGRGVMPGYVERLSDAEIEDVAGFILQRASEDWR